MPGQNMAALLEGPPETWGFSVLIPGTCFPPPGSVEESDLSASREQSVSAPAVLWMIPFNALALISGLPF